MSLGSSIRLASAYVSMELRGQKRVEALLRQAQKNISAAAAKITRAGAGITAVGLGLAAPFAIATRTFVEFDDAVRNLGAVSQASAEDLGRMREQALELGRTTSFTAAEVASLQVELAKLGFKPDAILESSRPILDLAATSRMSYLTLRQLLERPNGNSTASLLEKLRISSASRFQVPLLTWKSFRQQ